MERNYPRGQFIFKLVEFFVKDVEGLENIPDGPAILCANHQSYLDGPIPYAIIQPRLNKKIHAYISGKFYWPPLKQCFDWQQCIKIFSKDIMKGKPYDNTESYKLAEHYLKQGHHVLIFPEGKRSHDGKLLPGKPGAAHLSIITGAPIIPIGIIGSKDIWKKGSPIFYPHRKCRVRIGQPIYPDHTLEQKHELTRQVMQSIAELTNQTYDHD